jgi:Fe2+ or Zn2+ uptake regulation protein
VRDFTLDGSIERSLDLAFAGVAAAEGFTPRHHVIDVYGTCADCAD